MDYQSWQETRQQRVKHWLHNWLQHYWSYIARAAAEFAAVSMLQQYARLMLKFDPWDYSLSYTGCD